MPGKWSWTFSLRCFGLAWWPAPRQTWPDCWLFELNRDEWSGRGCASLRVWLLCVGTPARMWSGAPVSACQGRAIVKIAENDTPGFTSGRRVNPGVSQTAILVGRTGGVRAARHQECHQVWWAVANGSCARVVSLEARQTSRHLP